MNKNLAQEVLSLLEKWSNTDKEIVIENIEVCLYAKYPECAAHWQEKINKIAEITDSKPNTVYAWFNRGRWDVKVPLLKLCAIAIDLDIDIYKLLSEGYPLSEDK